MNNTTDEGERGDCDNDDDGSLNSKSRKKQPQQLSLLFLFSERIHKNNKM